MNNGDKPSYPVDYANVDSPRGVSEGLTKREYFAGIAMQGLLSNKYFQSYSEGMLIEDRIVNTAINVADALLTALDNK